jgi:heptose-I-phosphate ethanolaminephosphotransferase
MPALKAHEQQVFTNDLAFDTATGIWRARTNFYQSKYDFSSKDYSITMDNATTFERKKKIKDDPVWQGK